MSDGFPKPDEYSELSAKYFLPDGETGSAATVLASLGAGDTFKADVLYGLLHGMADDELVRFASACSSVAISRYPLPLNPPTLDEVNALFARG